MIRVGRTSDTDNRSILMILNMCHLLLLFSAFIANTLSAPEHLFASYDFYKRLHLR